MPTTELHTGETIIDVAIREYGNISGIFNLTKDNDLSFSSYVAPGSELIIDDTADYSEFQGISYEQIKQEQKNFVATLSGQNIFDISIQEFGTIEGIFNIIKNNNYSLSTKINAGTSINTTGDVIDKLVYNYFAAKSKPVTGSDIIVGAEPVLEGIGYWAIENNFRIG
ncbi:MAG: hypothetical protein IMY72_11710 [Bacteroidetes bacterium]|nr:hypothetical protein [Bacteroidota bacterium]